MKNLSITIMATMEKGATNPDDILEMGHYCLTSRYYDRFLWPVLDRRVLDPFLRSLFPNESPEANAGEAARERLFREDRFSQVVRPMKNLYAHFGELKEEDPRRRLPMHRYLDIISELGLLVLDDDGKEEVFAHFAMVGEMSFQTNTQIRNNLLLQSK